MKFLTAISDVISYIERSLVIFLLGTIISLAFIQVALRNIFATSFLWADPLLRHIVLVIVFFGASLATQQEKHITLDIFSRVASKRFVDIMRIVTHMFAVGITILLANAGYVFIQNEIEAGEIIATIAGIQIQAFWFQLIIPIGFGLMAFRFLIHAIKYTIIVIKPPNLSNTAKSAHL